MELGSKLATVYSSQYAWGPGRTNRNSQLGRIGAPNPHPGSAANGALTGNEFSASRFRMITVNANSVFWMDCEVVKKGNQRTLDSICIPSGLVGYPICIPEWSGKEIISNLLIWSNVCAFLQLQIVFGAGV